MLTSFELELFVAIADTGSITAAARVSGLTRATISRRLEALEERLGVTLINRTTRDFSLTEAGLIYLEGCRETLARLRQAESAVHELGGRARGKIRIACPLIRLEQVISPLVTSFAHAYPDIDIEVHLTSETCNPMVDNFDLVVQIGFEKNTALIAKCLAREQYGLVASPDYLARRPAPTTVGELANHDCIVAVRAHRSPEGWPLTNGETFTASRPRLLANATGLIRKGALEGLGIALIGLSLVREDLAEGALVRVLPAEVGRVLPVSLIYASGSKHSPKIRCFVDYVSSWVERFAQLPAEDSTAESQTR